MQPLHFVIGLLVLFAPSVVGSSYDVIVVGSGPGGAVAARRAVEAGYSVLLIERGKPYDTVPTVEDPALATIPTTTTDTGFYVDTLPQFTTIPLTTPKVFSVKDPAYAGGATAVNGMIHARGDAQQYFDEDWPSSWKWRNMKEYFKRYETFDGPDPLHTRGNHGPVRVTERTPQQNNLTAEFIDAVTAVWPHVLVKPNINSAAYFPGTSATETTSYGGHRVSSYTAYIRDLEQAGALTFMVNTTVVRVEFQHKKAKGVHVINTWTNQTAYYSASKAVIISAGTFGTPQLLQRSGVGNATLLRSLGIDVVSDLPDVGKHLDDHQPTVTMIFYPPAPWVSGEGVLYGWLYWNNADSRRARPDFSIELNTVPSPPYVFKVLSLQTINVRSRGSVTITSTDPTAPPALDLGYLNHQQDFAKFAEALNKTLELVGVLGWYFVPLEGNNPCNATLCHDKTSTATTWIKSGMVGVGYHFSGTAKLGKVVKKNTLEVMGTKNLYVCDASIFTRSPGANPQSTTYAVAERAIDLILDNIEEDD